MRYLSVCSGIEAASVAWHPLGWQAAAYSEIEAAPRAILEHHYPDTPLHGDFTTIRGDEYGAIDLLVGGTPCQSFSIAGLRGGLADNRGNLALEYLRLADRCGARWLVWENVPGVLSIDGGRAFGAILGGLAELGYGFAYRILDAQFCGVPQRRRRVFVVGYLGDWRRAAAVLFERHSLSGHSAPRREARASVAALTANGVGTCGADDNQGQAGHLIHCEPVSRALTACNTATGRLDPNEMEFIAHTLTSNGDAHSGYRDEKGLVFSIMPMNSGKDFKARETDVAQPLMAGGPVGGNQGGDYVCQPYTIMERGRGDGPNLEYRNDGTANAILTPNGGRGGLGVGAIATSAVRRLTPRECERLQGFPDDYTLVPYRSKMMADGPRYKALGNSMAVPCMRWIGERINAVEALSQRKAA